jgi:hypothetical protein
VGTLPWHKGIRGERNIANIPGLSGAHCGTRKHGRAMNDGSLTPF